jgi:hypothetical protein
LIDDDDDDIVVVVVVVVFADLLPLLLKPVSCQLIYLLLLP